MNYYVSQLRLKTEIVKLFFQPYLTKIIYICVNPNLRA